MSSANGSLSPPLPRLDIVSQPIEHGVTQVDLVQDTTLLSHLYITPLTLTIGVARVRVAGIGAVWTDERQRLHGFARHLLEHTLARLLAAAAAASCPAAQPDPASLSILWGIANFYEKFGYTPAAPDALVYLTDLPTSDPVPAGWTVRACQSSDVPAMQALYESTTAQAVGAVVRPTDGSVWTTLAEIARDPARDECRVVVRPDGSVAAYAWRGRDFWPVNTEEESPTALAIGETVAAGAADADALLAACRAWALEEAVRRPAVDRVELYLPRGGAVYAAATRQNARLELTWHRSGQCMARTLSPSGLLTALAPELTRRLRATRDVATGSLRLRTDLGTAQLGISSDGVAVQVEAGGDQHGVEATLELSQQALAQLALGTFAPDDLLDRLGCPVNPAARAWVEILFPRRQPYTHVFDWI
jgi:hypothetical protein